MLTAMHGIIASSGSDELVFDVSTASYASKSEDVSGQALVPVGLEFGSSGTKMYVCQQSNNTIYQYTLTTAWDLSTSSYDSILKAVTDEDTNPYDMAFNTDGTKMYVLGDATDTVYQYTLSTAWNVSTAIYASKLKAVGTEDGNPYGIAFDPDGNIMYIAGAQNNTIFQYTLGTAWDVSTASYASKLLDASTEVAAATGMSFSTDGLTMLLAGPGESDIYQYTLGTAWDIGTASYASKFKDTSDLEIFPYDVVVGDDNTKMYIVGTDSDTVYQYTLIH